MSAMYITRMNDQFIVENNPNGCLIRFLSPVPEEYKEVQIDGVCKEKLIEGIEKYMSGTVLMQEAFGFLEDYSHRELIVHGPEMVKMFKDMEDGDEE